MTKKRLFIAAIAAIALLAVACQNQKAGPTTSTSANGCNKPAALGTLNHVRLVASHTLAQASATPSGVPSAAPSASPMVSESPTPSATTEASTAPAVATTPATTSTTKKVVKLGLLGDLSGGNAALVVSAEKSAQLAIDEANANDNLPVTISLDALDNKDGSADTAPALAQQLIGDPSVVGVIGPAFSGETKATGALFCQAGLTDITQSATNPDLTKNGWPTFFRALANDSVQGGQTGAYIVKGLGKKKVAVINDKSDYGSGLSSAVVSSLKSNGADVVLNQGIEPTTDYTTIVDSVIAAKPDVLYYAGYDKDAPLLFKQYRQKGGTALLMGGDGDKGDNLLKEGGAAVDGAILTCPCLDPNASSDPAAQKFAQDYIAKYGAHAGIYSAEAWDVANMFIAAIKSGGVNTTRKSVLDYITNIKDYKGLSKTFNWTPQHEVVAGDITYVYKVVGGRYTLLGKASDLSGGSSAAATATP